MMELVQEDIEKIVLDQILHLLVFQLEIIKHIKLNVFLISLEILQQKVLNQNQNNKDLLKIK